MGIRFSILETAKLLGTSGGLGSQISRIMSRIKIESEICENLPVSKRDTSELPLGQLAAVEMCDLKWCRQRVSQNKTLALALALNLSESTLDSEAVGYAIVCSG